MSATTTAVKTARFGIIGLGVMGENLTQAQRDYFGAHTYQRTDRPEAGFVHTDWQSLAPSGNKKGQS